MTQQDHIINALVSSGYATVINGCSKKVVTLRRNVGRTDEFLFAGKAGSLRQGKTLSDSTPVLPEFKRFLILASKGQRQGPLPPTFHM